MKVALVFLGVLAIAQCLPHGLEKRAEVDGVVEKILAALSPDKTEEKPAATTEHPATTEKSEKEKEKSEVKTKREEDEEKQVQMTDAKTTKKGGVAVASSSLDNTKEKTPEPETSKGKAKRATVQSTNASGDKAISTADMKNEGPGSTLQSTKAEGGEIAFASSKMTTTSGHNKPHHGVKPAEPLPEEAGKTTEAPALPGASLPEPHPASEASSAPASSSPPAGVVQQTINPATGEKSTQVIPKA